MKNTFHNLSDYKVVNNRVVAYNKLYNEYDSAFSYNAEPADCKTDLVVQNNPDSYPINMGLLPVVVTEGKTLSMSCYTSTGNVHITDIDNYSEGLMQMHEALMAI